MKLLISLISLYFGLLLLITNVEATIRSTQSNSFPTSIFRRDERPPTCPPCFNCQLPAFPCRNYGQCREFDGRCDCIEGFGGDDCTTPLCGSLSQGKKRPLLKPGEKECKCEEGWSGLNCNMCVSDQVCDSMLPPGVGNATCYKGGPIVKSAHQQCDVTNQKIIDLLPNQKPQVTLACNKTSEKCNFQFWVDKIESFNCKFEECKFFSAPVANQDNKVDHQVQCKKILCQCLPDRFLCGKDNQVDIGEFLDTEITGPGKFTCGQEYGCKFEEPAMNNLILSIFGDDYIKLKCQSGECLHYTEVPGFKAPIKPNPSIFTYLALSVLIGIVCLIIIFFILPKKTRLLESNGYMPIDWDDEGAKLMDHHIPATLSFRDIGYCVNDVDILNGVNGIVKPCEVLAIMGASGAGKTSFLDILARRHKSGSVVGDILVNGKVVSNKEFRRIVGYVDQEDVLMPTLTVYETILNSALLRLPRDMSLQAKKLRVLECMKELSILAIKDSRVGGAGHRGISGGEKRRVSIACEMVTSPSILFLDEPTSGLDAFNALNVVECLVTLARDYKRTIIFTIHQPRSNIFNLFDRLLLLARGWTVYSGQAHLAAPHFDSIGYPCPPGYNIADYVIDLTQESESRPRLNDRESVESGPPELADLNFGNNAWSPEYRNRDQEQMYHQSSGDEDLHIPPTTSPLPHALAALALGFKKSPLAEVLYSELNNLSQFETEQEESNESSLGLRGYKRSSWLTQFQILSTRTFKNLYRDPQLMLANYAMALILAGLCGQLYYNVSDDIPGFQNRMGLFFFMCSLFAFSCLTSLHTFQPERLLFMRERANGYYSPLTYYLSKLLFDVVPLRVIPPIIMAIVIYPLVGLNPGIKYFLQFGAILVLFNLAMASLCLLLGIALSSPSLANLLASLSILFSMLFSGLFLNSVTIPPYLSFLKSLSLFNYALEALLVNEMRHLQLSDKRFGYVINIPAATILSTFGFDASNLYFDMLMLAVAFLSLTLAGYLALQFLVKEKR